jgi:hypothetical protein
VGCERSSDKKLCGIGTVQSTMNNGQLFYQSFLELYSRSIRVDGIGRVESESSQKFIGDC